MGLMEVFGNIKMESKRCFILSIFQSFKISKQVENILSQLIFMEIFGDGDAILMKNSFIPMPVKLTKKSIYKSVYCVKDYSLIIDEEGKVELWHNGIPTSSKMPQAFIRMYRAKSARK